MQSIDPASLKTRIARGDVIIIDVREPAEFAGERLPGARSVPLAQLAGLDLAAADGKALVLTCASGRRSAAGCAAIAARFRGEVLTLEGGLAAWKASGGPVEGSGKTVLPLDRQVLVAAGGLAATGFVLGVMVHPAFHALSGFVGAGLMVAGLTGFCGMALLLARAPWNRHPRAA